MAKQSIDTVKVANAADKLATANNNIDKHFETMKKKAVKLETEWNSKAGTTAHTLMYQLFSNSDDRSNVLKNYVDILNKQVNPDYIEAEKENMMFSKLADQFK